MSNRANALLLTGFLTSTTVSGEVIFNHNFNDEDLHTYTATDLANIWHTKNAGGLITGAINIVNDPDTSGSHGKAMQVFFAGGKTGLAGGGSQWPMNLDAYDELYTSFDVYFEPGFDFGQTGKLPSPRSTDWINKVTPGQKPDGTDFWSAGLAWYFYGELTAYPYHVNQPNRYGHTISWDDGADKKKTYFTPGQWHTVEVRVKVNTPGVTNGIMQGWFDGEKRLDVNNLLFRMPGGEHLHIGTYLFYTFFSGSAGPDGDQYAYFDNFVISTQPIQQFRKRRPVERK